MRSRYYSIEVYSDAEGRRIIVYETDFGLMAWLMWWRIKISADFKYPIMTIRS